LKEPAKVEGSLSRAKQLNESFQDAVRKSPKQGDKSSTQAGPTRKFNVSKISHQVV
jgi:hypothetical protein